MSSDIASLAQDIAVIKTTVLSIQEDGKEFKETQRNHDERIRKLEIGQARVGIIGVVVTGAAALGGVLANWLGG